MNTDVKKAKEIIEGNIYMVLATVTPDGLPWVSPVFFVYDHEYNFYWVSYTEAKHSHNVNKLPKVAISIFDSQALEGAGDGVYVQADVRILEEEQEIFQAIELWNNRTTQEQFQIKSSDEVTSTGVWRIYRATPYAVSKLTAGTTVNGQYVDKRIDINLI